MRFEEFKPGQIVEFVGEDGFSLYDTPGRDNPYDIGKTYISKGNKIVVLECVRWDECAPGENDDTFVRRLDLKVMTNRTVKYMDLREYPGICNRFRVVCE